MRGIETIRKSGRVLLALSVLAFATLVIVNGTGTAGVPQASPLAPAVEAASLAMGGAIRMCALAIGLVVGGILGMSLNPLGGATAISLGLHLGLATC